MTAARRFLIASKCFAGNRHVDDRIDVELERLHLKARKSPQDGISGRRKVQYLNFATWRIVHRRNSGVAPQVTGNVSSIATPAPTVYEEPSIAIRNVPGGFTLSYS